MKASRLVALLLLLQRRRQLTAAGAARELEVSVRTVYRDLRALTAAGVPIATESGPGGGIRIVEGWRTQLDGLTSEEISAILLSGAPQVLADLGYREVATTARAKLDATLPDPLRARAALLRERLHVDAPGWFGKPDDVRCLPTIVEAVLSARRVAITYGAEPRRFVVRPLGLVIKSGIWYLVALRRGEPRTYRVGRIAQATLGEGFVRPPFDLAAHWRAGTAAFEDSTLRFPCRLRLSRHAARRLPDLAPHDRIREAIAAAGPPDPEGFVTVDLRLEGEEVAADQLTGLGAGFEVLSPPSLRRRVREVARAMLRRHRAR